MFADSGGRKIKKPKGGLGAEVKIVSTVHPYYRLFVVCWYLGVLVFLSVYVISDWSEALCFVSYNRFNGTNLLFFAWLYMLLLPFVRKVELFGGKVDQDHESLFSRAIAFVVNPTGEDKDASTAIKKTKSRERGR